MPFRATFDCLWCGMSHTTRSDDDVEGWAQLCPACAGRAGENAFLRFRLRAALDERGRARRTRAGELGAPSDRPTPEPLAPNEPASRGHDRTAIESTAATVDPALPWPGPLSDDWYLRRGRHSLGAIGDATWAADLDAATLWIDALPLHGRIVEVDAGGGWWSPLLAGKGELWVHLGSEAELERARRRLVGHGLRAHLHLGEPAFPPDSPADAVVAAFLLGRLPDHERATFLVRARGALRPGGALVVLELHGRDVEPSIASEGAALGGAGPGAGVDPVGPGAGAGLDQGELEEALRAAGFSEIRIERTSRFFVLGLARA